MNKRFLATAFATAALVATATAMARPVTPGAQQTTMVTVDNFARAESDRYMAGIVRQAGMGVLGHRRELSPLDKQAVIRMNRDTLYSGGVFDLDAGPVTVKLPPAAGRFMSVQVTNEDHFVPTVFYDDKPHVLTREHMGTRYILVTVRTLVDPADSKDMAMAHALQDAIVASQPARGKLEIPNWDPVSQKKVRDGLLSLSAVTPDFRNSFGRKGEVDPVRHLIASAAAWGGNPDKDAIYLNVTPTDNSGKTNYRLKVDDVPVDGFWSVSVYNEQGYFEKNNQDAYSLNSLTSRRDSRGQVVLQFGGCEAGVENCLPIMPGWNYTVRLYRPRAEVLNGTWTFPEPVVIQ